MTDEKRDIWSEWLVHQRKDWTDEQRRRLMHHLHPIRDKVLANAKLQPGQTLLDVGCGDGLIAFGALQQDTTVRVIFADISDELLDRSRSLAEQAQVQECCTFVLTSADDLSSIEDASVDVVTTRSVLIYVDKKQQAFTEFHRVLKPRGRLSIFEPINRFGWPEAQDRFWCCDVAAVAKLADKVKALYAKLQPMESDPMMNFDERDLVRFAEIAGFDEVNLRLELKVGPQEEMQDWNEVYLAAPTRRFLA